MEVYKECLKQLAETVRGLRQGHGWTRRDLAEKTGISERFLADVEAARANLSLMKICELARVFELSPSRLLATDPVRELASSSPSPVIALLGLRGAGKSSVGKALAQRLGRRFVELDQEVERFTGLPLAEMFQLHGESYYRSAERQVLARMLQRTQEPLVLATGGGLVTERATYDLLRSHCRTVWLRATPRDHWLRVLSQGDTRPMDDDEQAFNGLCAIFTEREPLYRQAEVTVETSGRTVDQVTDEVMAHLGPERETA